MTAAIESSFPTYPLRRFVNELTDGPFGSSLTSSHYSDNGARVIRLGNIGAANFKDDDSAYIPMDYFSLLRQHEVKPGDLIIAGLGDGNHPVGRACIAPDDLGPAIVKADCFRARLDEDRLTHRFAAWALSSSVVSELVLTLTRGSTRARINLEVAKEIQLPVPSVAEQRKISEFLDVEMSRLDRLIVERKKQVNLLQSQWISELSETSARLSDQFGVIRLRHLMNRIEQGWSPQCEDRPVEKGEWGVLKAGAVNGGVFDPSKHKALPSEIVPRREYLLRQGDLLMSRASGSVDLIGSVGIVGSTEDNLLLCDKIYRISLEKMSAHTEFVAHMLRTHWNREHIKIGISGAEGMANNLPAGVVKDCLVPKVPLKLQVEIASKLDAGAGINSKLQGAIERSIRLITERWQALITAAVTGQFDVSTASGRGVTE